MGEAYLLDCTLRDGGYINDWRFGENTIRGICRLLAQAGLDYIEVGFLKGDTYDADRSMFPDTDSFSNVICPKSTHSKYVGMLDMSAPVPITQIKPRNESTIDGIRVIFKKDKLDLAYEYCKKVKELGYFVTVNFVSTDQYTDKEFIDGIERFNTLYPAVMTIVDTFGMIKRKQFMRLVYLADNNMAEGVMLGYHAHNNLQQAFGNAEALIEMNLKRDVLIDACVFGMGRGAGNLNLELFAEHMNDSREKNYKIEPILEIMDSYLNEIYRTKFWGYSLPLYLSATAGCHPNYAIYLAEKNTLTVKAFNELLQRIPSEAKGRFNKEKAEFFYRNYMENYLDDKYDVERLEKEWAGKTILVLAPGRSLNRFAEQIKKLACDEKTVVIAANFAGGDFEPDYVFSSNMRRFAKIQEVTSAKCIVTSNMKECTRKDYVVNFSSYSASKDEIIDNSALMLLRLLVAAGVKETMIAGMDGYSLLSSEDYYDERLTYDFSREAKKRNEMISEELCEIGKSLKMIFLTPTVYKF